MIYRLVLESDDQHGNNTRDEIDVDRETYIGMLKLLDEIWAARQGGKG